MKALPQFLILLLTVMPISMHGAVAAEIGLDTAMVNLNDEASLQRGAELFTSRCLACHAAAYMRYNRLMDIGMSAEQIKKDLNLPEDVRLGSVMQPVMDANSAKVAFGAAPPDLSVIARSRGADWLYTYLRTFYQDTTRPSGWNNTTYPNVAMPFVLADLQGTQVLHVEKRGDVETKTLALDKPGSMRPAEYDAAVADLINYLVFMSDPSRMVRHQLGYAVLGFLLVLLALVYALKKEIWKDVH